MKKPRSFVEWTEFFRRTPEEELRKLLAELDPTSRPVIEYCFGVCDRPKLPLKDIGIRFGCTQERIRQIRDVTLEKLAEHMDAD